MTKLSDIVYGKTFQTLVISKLTENSKLRQAGIVKNDPDFQIGKGFETTMPFWRHPAGGEATSQNDDENVKGVAGKLTQGSLTARVFSRARGIAAMNIASYACNDDAIAFARSEFARLRQSDEESVLLATLEGMIAANILNQIAPGVTGKEKDMLVDSAITTGTISDANRFGPTTLIAGRKTMGDRGSDLKMLIMHSDLVNNLRAKEPNAFIPASQTDIGLEKYQGAYVVETDNVGIAGTANYPIYTSYFVGPELFGYAEGVQDYPLEDARDPFAGNYSSKDTTINRYRFTMHPFGYNNGKTPANGVSLTNAELKDAANWTRVVERKAVPLVAIRTNG